MRPWGNGPHGQRQHHPRPAVEDQVDPAGRADDPAAPGHCLRTTTPERSVPPPSTSTHGQAEKSSVSTAMIRMGPPTGKATASIKVRNSAANGIEKAGSPTRGCPAIRIAD